jgi:hypothetical protein
MCEGNVCVRACGMATSIGTTTVDFFDWDLHTELCVQVNSRSYLG